MSNETHSDEIYFTINDAQFKSLLETGFCACFGIGGNYWMNTIRPGSAMVACYNFSEYKVRVVSVQDSESGASTRKDLVIAPALS